MKLTGISDEAGATLAEQIHAHQVLGWDHLELRKIEDRQVSLLTDEECAGVSEQLQSKGMRVAGIGSPIGNFASRITDPFVKSVEMMNQTIRNAARLDTRLIRIMSYPNDGLDDREWHRKALHRVKELGKMADGAGMVLMLENCSGWAASTPERFGEFLAEVDSPSVRAVFDTGNPASHHPGAPRVLEWFEAARPCLVHVHIKDHTGRSQGVDARHLWPGEGVCCLSEVFGRLREMRYDGFLSIEPHIGIHPDHATRMETYLEYGKRIKEMLGA
ncbi:MAG: sugar phosphate isomerase/epimerase [Verrucomicrobia bacterium]|nr:sugar phosphate isomerase/epimerase [Verrucomicrobiota bacterium]MCH8527560.1 sugar phosphate isomerase/epimerase [Kiritimatiellia bacterium]